MADNVSISSGAGTSIATDDVAGIHYQRVKLDAGGDGSSVPVTGSTGLPVKEIRATISAVTSVSGSASSVSLLASNASRLGAAIYNDSSALLYVKLGATASTTSFTVKLSQNDYYEVPFGYSGNIDGIWASATGSARITEAT